MSAFGVIVCKSFAWKWTTVSLYACNDEFIDGLGYNILSYTGVLHTIKIEAHVGAVHKG
jgi:hypothetical protein